MVLVIEPGHNASHRLISFPRLRANDAEHGNQYRGNDVAFHGCVFSQRRG